MNNYDMSYDTLLNSNLTFEGKILAINIDTIIDIIDIIDDKTDKELTLLGDVASKDAIIGFKSATDFILNILNKTHKELYTKLSKTLSEQIKEREVKQYGNE